MDCEKCTLELEQRKLWSCAFVPEKERSGEGPTPPAYPYDRPTLCPGYLTSLPQVIEAARASSWRRDSALDQFYDRPITDIARTCIDIISAEFKAVEQHVIRESREQG